MIGSLDDPLRRSIILLKLHDLAIFVIPLEIEDVLDIRAPPAVYPLPIVSHDADILRLRSEPLHDAVLSLIRILILIDQEILETVMEMLEHVRNLEDIAHLREDIVEIEGIHRLQSLLIGIEDLRYLLFEKILHIESEGFRVDSIVLRVADGVGDRAGSEFLRIQTFLFQNPSYEPELVILVDDREILLVSQTVDEHAQEIDPDRVECPDERKIEAPIRIDSFDIPSEGLSDPLLHLFRCLIGECYTED